MNNVKPFQWIRHGVGLMKTTSGVVRLGIYINTEDTETGLLITARSPAGSREKIK